MGFYFQGSPRRVKPRPSGQWGQSQSWALALTRRTVWTGGVGAGAGQAPQEETQAG